VLTALLILSVGFLVQGTTGAETQIDGVPPEWDDPPFDGSIDLGLLSKAWQAMDPSLMTDAALQLAQGERAQRRPHKAFSSDQVLNLAAKMALEKRDKAALERLAKAAKRTGNKDLAARVEAGLKLAGEGRDDDQAWHVSVEQMPLPDFVVYQRYLNAIWGARIRGDRKALERLQTLLPKWTGGSEQQREYLKRVLAESRNNLAPPEKLAAALDNLVAASRDWGFSLPPVSVPDPTIQVPIIPDFGPGGGGGPSIQIPLLPPGSTSDSSSSGDDSASEPQQVTGSFLTRPNPSGGKHPIPPHTNKKLIGTGTKKIIKPITHHQHHHSKLWHRSRDFPLLLQARAVGELDASLLADVALEMVEQERTLMRVSGGMSAGEAIDLAVRVAYQIGDRKTIDRLARAAKNLSDKELSDRIASHSKLGSSGRDVQAGRTLPVGDTTSEQFDEYLRLFRDIELAFISGDAKKLKDLRDEVKSAGGLTPGQRDALEQRIKGGEELVPPTPDAQVLRTLAKLQDVARDDVSFSEWDSSYTTPGGTVSAHVVLQGNSGSYTLSDGSTGSLSNIRYSGRNVVIIRGIWSLGGQLGLFEWRVVPDGSQFLGNWRYLDTKGRPQGAWNATRSDGGNG
jgi:hypothetical protein